MHVPLCLHGFGAQSLILVWQTEPLYPAAQVHEYESTASVHVPLLRHGFGAQSLILVWQVVPLYPALQVQVQPFNLFMSVVVPRLLQ